MSDLVKIGCRVFSMDAINFAEWDSINKKLQIETTGSQILLRDGEAKEAWEGICLRARRDAAKLSELRKDH